MNIPLRNTKLVIGIITYKRPDNLKNCIQSLLKQICEIKYDIIVVDNDKEQSAKRIVQSFNVENILYQVEEVKGIPYARNKVVKLIMDKYKYLAFIDDDEIANVDWLENLYKTIIEYDVDVVSGPVYAH